MKYCQFIALMVATLFTTQGLGQDNSDWFRQAAISPTGESILFSYQGDIYTVPSQGGSARPLTIHSACEGHPVWSHDGQQIAFASDRHGNLDVFVMPATGGKATRLTHHSADDLPTDFSPSHDGILFSSARTDNAVTSQFPTSRQAELYTISTGGGTPKMVSTIPGSEARYDNQGKKILYRDEKAYEIDLRKHDTSAFARDIWLHDLATNQHTQLTTYQGGDHGGAWGLNRN